MNRPCQKKCRFWPLALLIALLTVPGCGEDKKATPKTSQASAARKAAKAEKKLASEIALPTETPVTDSFIYTPVGKRDPFKSAYKIIKEDGQDPGEVVTSPLQRFEIDQLSLIAVISGISQPRAMVVGPDKTGYSVKIGTRIGKHFGRVVKIKSSELIIAEDYRDWNGRKVTNYIHMAIKKDSKSERR